jgi:hypothetical protein
MASQQQQQQRRRPSYKQDVMKRLEDMFRSATLSTPEYHPPIKVEVMDPRRCSVHHERRGSMPALAVRRDSLLQQAQHAALVNRRNSLGPAKSHQQLIGPTLIRRDSISKSQTLVPASAIIRRDSFGRCVPR